MSNAQPLVLLHGIGGSARAFSAVQPILAARGLRTLAWNAPGYAGEALTEPFTLANLARSLAGWLDDHALEKVTLVGHSMGGMIAQEFHAAFPERVSSMVLALTSPAFGGSSGDFQRQFIESRIAPLDAGKTMRDIAMTLVPNMLGRNSRAGLRQLPGAGTRPGAWVIENEAQMIAGAKLALEVMSEVPPGTYRLAVAALTLFDQRARLTEIKVPTLCLAGEDDTTAAPSMMQKMAEKIPGARYEVLPGLGHLGPMEQPEAFADSVTKFISAT